MCLFFDPYALFTLLTFLFRNTSGHTSPRRKSFSFFSKHHTFFRQPTFSDNTGGWLYYKLVGHLQQLVGRLQQLLGWRFDWSETSRTQASLFRDDQDGVSHHNEYCLGTSCGGINPYTLMARLGLAQT
jgi:hypothetical protein